MTLDKRLVDEVIRLIKKYYKTSDHDYSSKIREVEKFLLEKATWQEVGLLYDLAKYAQISGRATNADIYNALKVFGIIVEDKELENEV